MEVSGNLLVFEVSVATVTVHCPRCHSDEVYRHGRSCSRH
ncbi:TPA: hypothetical protein L1241_002560, partial [Escherichia coli]|nr:hypothetical protein [Escherichia coli]HBN2124869.1 hypothetical protein [Escherichia coli]